MKTLNELVLAASDAELHIKVDSDRLSSVARRRDEGLYHIRASSRERLCGLSEVTITCDLALATGERPP
jgi:hypothetical protein